MTGYERKLFHQILANQLVIMGDIKYPTKKCKAYEHTMKILEEYNTVGLPTELKGRQNDI